MGAMKRLVDERADAGLCVLCGGEADNPQPFMSGFACWKCEAIHARDLAEWAVEQAEKQLAEAEARLGDR